MLLNYKYHLCKTKTDEEGKNEKQSSLHCDLQNWTEIPWKWHSNKYAFNRWKMLQGRFLHFLIFFFWLYVGELGTKIPARNCKIILTPIPHRFLAPYFCALETQSIFPIDMSWFFCRTYVDATHILSHLSCVGRGKQISKFWT